MTIFQATFAVSLVLALSMSAGANELSPMNPQKELDKEIKSICTAYSDVNMGIYCTQAQYSSYINLANLSAKNSDSKYFLNLQKQCAQRYSNVDAFTKVDYAMVFACINRNAYNFNIQLIR